MRGLVASNLLWERACERICCGSGPVSRLIFVLVSDGRSKADHEFIGS